MGAIKRQSLFYIVKQLAKLLPAGIWKRKKMYLNELIAVAKKTSRWNVENISWPPLAACDKINELKDELEGAAQLARRF